jgi:hypothetical protein
MSAEPTTREIKAALAKLGFIANLWHIDDVRQERPDLTEEQAWSVLQACEDRHDANIGINWEVIQMHAEELFPEPKCQTMPRYEVHREVPAGWKNCWTDDDGNPLTFETRDDAAATIADHINDCLDAVRAGNMIDAPGLESFRISLVPAHANKE